MTAKQDTLYWREWGAVTRFCKANAQSAPDRHELHRRALAGRDPSHRDFSNADFDAVLGEFRAWSRPGDVNAQLRQARMSGTRATWKLLNELVPLLAVFMEGLEFERGLAAERYVAAVCDDKFGTDDIRSLTPLQVTQLVTTIEVRVVQHRKKAGLTAAELRNRAGLENKETRKAGGEGSKVQESKVQSHLLPSCLPY